MRASINFFALLLLLVALTSSACKPKQKTVTQAETPVIVEDNGVIPPKPEPEDYAVNEADLIASINRGSCYGRCPAYEIKLYKDGRAILHAKAFMPKLGYFQDWVSQESIVALIDKAKEVNYFSFAEQYPTQPPFIADLPSCKTYIKIGETSKTVLNKHDAPSGLIEFEKFFDELFLNLEWHPTADPKSE